MGAWDFNGNESGDRIIESDEKKKNVFKSKNYTKKKKRTNCVTGSVQLTVLSKMEEKLLVK